MTIEVELVDGRILEFPDGTSPEVIQSTARKATQDKYFGVSTAELKAAPSAPMSFGDTARSGIAGLTGALGSAVSAFGADTAPAQGLRSLTESIQSGMTPERLEEQRRRDELMQRSEKEGLGAQILAGAGAVAEAPIQSIAQGLGSSIPAIAAGLVAVVAGAPVAIAGAVGLAARAIFGAVQGAGEAKSDIYSSVKAKLMESGKSEAQAEAEAAKAQEYVSKNLPGIIGSSLAGAVDAATGVESIVGKGALKSSVKPLEKPSLLRETFKQAGSEALPEGIQGGVGQVTQNVALQNAGFDTSTFEGVAGATTRDALMGALTGGAVTPLQMSSLRRDYELDKQRKVEEESQALEEKLAQEEQARQDQIAKTKEDLGLNMEIPALPAPAEQIEEPPVAVDPLKNPLGNIQKNEIPEISQVIDEYRQNAGLPPLKDYSVEDLVDAMPGEDPKGEEALLNQWLTAKTGWTKENKMTAQNVLEQAKLKNIETKTKGFEDFLARVTGYRDLTTMSQPQLYAAFTALSSLPESDTTQILPEGTNASRFSEEQYLKALVGVDQLLDGLVTPDGSQIPVDRGQVIKEIQQYTGLTNTEHAESILDEAIRTGDLDSVKTPRYRTVDPATGQLKGVAYDSRKAAEAAAKQKGYEVKEITAEGITAPSTAATLPEGFDIRKGSFKEGEAPEGYSILSGDEDLYRAKTPEEAASKKASFEKTRSGMANAIDNQITQKLNSVEQSQIRLDRMEAKGEGQTVSYAKAKGKHAQLQETVNKDIEALLAKKAGYEAPIAIKPFGKRAVGRTGFTIFEGDKATATYPSRTAAEEAILATLSDNQLRQLTKDQGRRGLGKRAETELKRRTAPPPAQGKKVSEVLEGIEEEKRKPKPVPPEVKANIEKLEKELRPLLEKLGLGKVTLNVVQDIENNAEGAFSETLMRIAMDSKKPVRTMRHESIHALKELGFFTPAQWNTLQRMAKDKWIQTYLKDKNAIHNGKSMTRFDAYMDIYGGNMETIMEEAIADAFADFDVNKAPPGLITALLNRIRAFFEALRNAMAGAGFQTAEEVFGMAERGELVENPSAWKATPEEQDEAARYSVNNGIDPYTSDGQLNVPLESDGTKYSIKQAYTEEQKAKAARTENRKGEEKKAKILKNDPITGLPLNQNGTVTLYYPTDNDGARALAKSKRLKGHSPTANRIYLTNESSAPAIAANPGMIEQPLGGANVLLEIDPSLIHELPTNYADGRRDFFIPIAEGEVFAKKMKKTKLFTLNALRTKGLHPDRTLNQVTKMVNDAASKWESANAKDRRIMAAQAKETLLANHNITNLFGANSKLEKTNIGEYGLTYDGKKVMSTGLGFASAQKINDEQRATTCPQSGICEDLCLGETSGQNLLYGGEGQWRSGPRLSQYLKTEALVVNPEAFAIAMIKQITSFRKAANDLGYYPAVRLNVTSDFNPKTFEGIIKMFPDVMFYDYTKLDTKPIAPNHHLTYSSTGASQVVDGDIVYNKFSNWDRMVDKVLPSGRNVAMAFTSRSAMPKFVMDQRTGKRFEVWNGDEYDARFLDPIKKDGDGWIIGLTNKDNTTKPEDAAKKHNGFFLDYDPERDGDTLVIQDQEKLKAGIPQPITFKKPEKYSLKELPPAPGTQPIPKGTVRLYHQTTSAESLDNIAKEGLSIKYAKGVEGPKAIYAGETPFYGPADTKPTVEFFVAKDQWDSPFVLEDVKPDQIIAAHYPWHKQARYLEAEPDSMKVALDGGFDDLTDPDTATAVKYIKDKYKNQEPDKYSLRAAPESEEFKQWFGDSKIVDSKGKPVLLYHATNFSEEDKIDQENVFSVFKESDDGKLGAGIYSSSLPKYAESYGPTGTVMPLYASIKNPLVINMDADSIETDADGYQSVAIKVGIRANTALEGVAKKILAKNPDFKTESKRYLRGPEVQELLEMGGYDGVVLEDNEGNFVEVNAFKPEQLKSATGNVGTYDAANPDIRYSLKEAPDTPEFKQWFGDSKVVDENGRPMVVYHATAKDFMYFDPKKLAKNTRHPTAKLGFFTAANPASTDEFITVPYGLRRGAYEEGANIMPLYASIQNPAIIPSGDFVMQSMALQNMKKKDADKFIDDYLQSLRDEGHDGILIKANKTGRGLAGGNEFTSDNWVALDPSQLKSAIGNTGAYGQRVPTAQEAKSLKMSQKKAVESQEKGDVRFSLREAPDTPSFKRFFAGSKVVNEDGSPKVMYHGTNKDFNEFLIAKKANRTGMPDGFYFTSDAEDASRYAKGDGANVMPVYLSIKNPYNLGGKNKISKEMVMQFRDELRQDNPNLPFSWIQEKVNIFKENTAAGRFPFPSISFPTAAMQRVFEAGGYDGLIDGSRVFVAFNPSQIKSATGNVGTFDKESSDVRFSLRYSLDPSIKERVNATTTSREEKGHIDRMIEAISPSTYSRFRAQALNRYDQLSKYDKILAQMMGGVELLADASAEAAALMSDLGAGITASVLGVHDRNGGIPVFRKGITTVDGSVKGPISIFVPLAKLNDPAAYRDYQFWSGVKRGRPFIGEGGKEQLFKEGDIKKAELLEKEYKDMGVSFDQIQKEWIQYNNGLVKYLVDTGVLSEKQADLFTKWSDYVPFYRQMDGEKTVGPNIFQSISGVKQPKKYKGETEAPLADFLETIVRNTQSAIQMGVKNTAAQRAVSVATQIQMAEKLKFKPKSMISVVTVLEDGKETYYDCYDPLFIESVKSLNMPDLPFIGLLAAPANILRNLVTKDPGFMMANMMRDSLSAWVTSGAKMTPIASTIANFGKSLAGTSPEFKALLNAGILGGYEFSQNTEQSGQTLAQALRLKAGTGNLGDKASSLWGLLEKGTTASDAATRIEVYKSTLAETGNEAEALFRSLEVMNFNRKGSSAVIRVMTAAIPFLNARMQGLDVLYRAGIRPLTDKLLFGKEPTQREKEIQRIFFVRGMTISALSAMYWMLTHDDEEYKKQEQETKDNYWLFPSLGVKIPIPFEVGVIFKVLPERLMALTVGDDTAKDFRESMARNIRSTLAIDYLPQTIKPIVEVESNFSYFTRRPIIGQGLDGVGDPFQVGPTTSLVAEKIGKQIGMSPMKVDHLINGYTGTIGMYMVDALDAIMDMNSDSPKASKRFEQMPVLKRFALDPEARGNVSAYYEMKNSVDEVVRTSNLLERTSNYKEWGPYMEDNIKLLATKDYILDLENSMKEFREMQVLIRSSSLSADEKRDALLNITKAQNALTSNIQLLKKSVQ